VAIASSCPKRDHNGELQAVNAPEVPPCDSDPRLGQVTLDDFRLTVNLHAPKRRDNLEHDEAAPRVVRELTEFHVPLRDHHLERGVLVSEPDGRYERALPSLR
jgi:hypothetical protein